MVSLLSRRVHREGDALSGVWGLTPALYSSSTAIGVVGVPIHDAYFDYASFLFPSPRVPLRPSTAAFAHVEEPHGRAESDEVPRRRSPGEGQGAEERWVYHVSAADEPHDARAEVRQRAREPRRRRRAGASSRSVSVLVCRIRRTDSVFRTPRAFPRTVLIPTPRRLTLRRPSHARRRPPAVLLGLPVPPRSPSWERHSGDLTSLDLLNVTEVGAARNGAKAPRVSATSSRRATSSPSPSSPPPLPAPPSLATRPSSHAFLPPHRVPRATRPLLEATRRRGARGTPPLAAQITQTTASRPITATFTPLAKPLPPPSPTPPSRSRTSPPPPARSNNLPARWERPNDQHQPTAAACPTRAS